MPTRFDDRVAELRGFTTEVVRYRRLALTLWTSAIVLVPLSCLLILFVWSKWQAKRPEPAPAKPAPVQVVDPFQEEIRRTSVQDWFARLGQDEQFGYKQFTVMNALIAKAKHSETNRDAVVQQASQTIQDLRQNMVKRWHACYVLSGVGDPRGIPAIARALRDQSPIVRGVAICAMGVFDHPDAKAALENAFKQEREPRLRQEIQKALQGDYHRH